MRSLVGIYTLTFLIGILVGRFSAPTTERLRRVSEWAHDFVRREDPPILWQGNFYALPNGSKPYRMDPDVVWPLSTPMPKMITVRFTRVDDPPIEKP